MTSPVERRLFFHIGGYDPMSPEAAHRRFSRELGRFREAWSAKAEAGPLSVDDDTARWSVTASGPDWAVATDVRLLRWDDVMDRLAGRSIASRLGQGALTIVDFIVSGALWGYARFAWRYALFFLYPVLLLALPVVLAIVAAAYSGRAFGSPWLGLPIGIAVLAGLIVAARSRLMLDHLLDDWIFGRDHIRDPDPILMARLDRIADQIVTAARSGASDGAGEGAVQEVVVLGHSLGAVLAVETMDRALARDPSLGTGVVRVALVTVGSSILKIGLHRGATRLRTALGRVGSAPGVFWVEYQSITDVMNFYKVDPVAALRAGPTGPLLRIARMSRMLSKAYYRRIKLNLFRIHNQFVSGNDVRALYDYFMVACGPWPIEAQAQPREGAMAGLRADGSLADPFAPQPDAGPSAGPDSRSEAIA